MAVPSAIPIKTFHGSNGTVEHYIALEAFAGDDFETQLTKLEETYDALLRAHGIDPHSGVFRRIFLSDIINHQDRVRQSRLASPDRENPVAVSLIQQPPLSGSKIALLAYHICSPAPLVKKALPPCHLLVEKSGLKHLWSVGLRSGSEERVGSAQEQTRKVFASLVAALAQNGGRLCDHCLRTWIYMASIDVFYGEMVQARRELFEEQGLTTRTHYIASTGINGCGPNPFDVINMDAYSILGITEDHISFLHARDHLNRTHEYGVTFERGTRVAYADRAHVFLSGTASIDAAGNIVHIGNAQAQMNQAIRNGEAILKSAGAQLEDMMYAVAYFRDASDYPRLKAAFHERFPTTPTLLVHGPVCRPQWLFEFEGLAITPGDDASLSSF